MVRFTEPFFFFEQVEVFMPDDSLNSSSSRKSWPKQISSRTKLEDTHKTPEIAVAALLCLVSIVASPSPCHSLLPACMPMCHVLRVLAGLLARRNCAGLARATTNILTQDLDLAVPPNSERASHCHHEVGSHRSSWQSESLIRRDVQHLSWTGGPHDSESVSLMWFFFLAQGIFRPNPYCILPHLCAPIFPLFEPHIQMGHSCPSSPLCL